MIIVSGGQTGVDRAALDVARELGFETGGWCPRGRLAEDGGISVEYLLNETPSDAYTERTEWNVRDSDGTLILTIGSLTGGTAYTAEVAGWLNKPCLIVDIMENRVVEQICSWLEDHDFAVLNVAGPRESKSPGMYRKAGRILRAVLLDWSAGE